MFFRHRQIIDVDFTPVPLEFVQFVGSQATRQVVALECGNDNEVRFGEQRLEIVVLRNSGLISSDIVESISENAQQLLQKPHVG